MKSLRGFRKFPEGLLWPGPDKNVDITVYQKRSIRSGGGGSQSEKSQHKGFHRQYGCRIGEWPVRECQETSSGPWCVAQNGLCRSHENGEALKECRPGGWKNSFPWRWRPSDSGRVRWPKRWRPQFFDSLSQRSHCLIGGWGRTASWPASFSLRRPPIRTEMGVWEIAQWRVRQGAPAVMRALPEVREDSWRPYWQKLKIQMSQL